MSLVIPGMGRTVPYSGPTTNAPSGYKPQGGFPQHSPGRAQSIPSQSRGTPYGQQANYSQQTSGGGRMHSGYRGMSAPTPGSPGGPAVGSSYRSTGQQPQGTSVPQGRYALGTSQQTMQPFPGTPPQNVRAQQGGYGPEAIYAAGTSEQYMQQFPDTPPQISPQSSGYGMPQQQGGYQYDGNLAYAPPDQRPPPFQAFYGQMGGGYSDQPNYGQRDAFVSQINNQLGQMQRDSWNRPMGAPQFDFGQMWGRAGDMVQQGWQNPLMGLTGGQKSPAPVWGAAPPGFGQAPSGRARGGWLNG